MQELHPTTFVTPQSEADASQHIPIPVIPDEKQNNPAYSRL
jgi:hypothetical protein